jgi:hypothetical protein
MEVVWGAVISASVFLAIPLFGWFSRRATKEGRLTLRVERMGTVYSAMPESAERTTYEAHYRRAIGELNNWLDIDAKALRRSVRAVFVFSYIFGIIVFTALGPLIAADNSVLTTLFGTLVAFIIGVGAYGGQYFLERRATRRQEVEHKAAKEKAFRKGEPLTKDR